MSDLISRQAAIARAVPLNLFGREVMMVSVSELENLPSVQPEVIRCKDCKWCEDADGLICKNTASWVVATDYDFGCVCAERRQDD